jgi:predicted Zn-dependent protease
MRFSFILLLIIPAFLPGGALAADNATRVVLYTLGPVSKEWVNLTEDVTHAAYGYYTEYRGDAALLDDYGPSESGVYYAREILEDMDVIAAVEKTRVIVLTELTLKRKKDATTTCAGLSHSSRGTAVISIFNADKNGADTKTAQSRVVKRLLHEIGHASGLHHCRQPLCYMAFYADVSQSDTAHFALCPRCSRVLEANTGINYKIAREHLIAILTIRGILDNDRDNLTAVPPPPEDLNYDLAGTEKLEEVE